MKYYNAMVVFEEIPNEITLAINITNCPCHCKGCHSKFLWEDVGTDLSYEELERLIKTNDGITTVCFMGGDANPYEISKLAHMIRLTHRKLKVGWYSGRDELSKDINLDWLDYIKLGHYDEDLGGLNKETTNQRLYKVIHEKMYAPTFESEAKVLNHNKLDDITNMFWKKMLK